MACQSAWAAVRTKNCYLSAQFKRLAARRGSKRALIAVAHSLLVIGYHIPKKGRMYQELGGDYFDHLNAERQTPSRKATRGPRPQCYAATTNRIGTIFEGAGRSGRERLFP